jgi:hypothetical protein
MRKSGFSTAGPSRASSPILTLRWKSPAGLAAQLAQESDQVSDVRCFDANESDGWDLIRTYLDARTGERLKSGYRIGPGSVISSDGAVPEDMPLPAAPASQRPDSGADRIESRIPLCLYRCRPKPAVSARGDRYG